MANVGVVTDTIAQVPDHLAKELGIVVIPAATVTCDGAVLTDGIDLTMQKAFDCLARNPGQWTTSAIPPAYFVRGFEQLVGGTGGILCITASSKLTAVNRTATLAAEEVRRLHPGVCVQVYDSLSASGAEGLIVLAAARAARQGASLMEAAAVADAARKGVWCMFVFETLRYVYRTGRVPRVVGEAADRLGVKPLARVGQDGKVHFVAFTRSRRKGVATILDSMRAQFGTQPVEAMVVHTAAHEEAEGLRQEVRGSFNCAEVPVSEFSPLMGYATGPGVLGVAMGPGL